MEIPTTLLVADPAAFAIGQVVAGEAELLMIATDPDHRRKGLATSLLSVFEAEARARGAEAGFLDVAEDNSPARALYGSAGWIEVGCRPAYYRRTDAPPVDALLMKKAL